MTAVVLAVLLGGAAGMALVGVWDLPPTVTDVDRLKLDRIKTGLTIAAGLAAGVTLLMALRRQSLSERAQRFAESDALEQRTTALYVAAVDQLGSDKAAVRLAGLYVLERLGQDNPKLRQTVFDVWCAYLRMPYTPPVEVLQRNADRSPARPKPDTQPPEPKDEAERRQELQVRLTAQRLLAAHLRNGDGDADSGGSYWYTDIATRLSIDLSGAVLVHFNLANCTLDQVDLSETQFHGSEANLGGAQFHGATILYGAQFHGQANLFGVQFPARANLGDVQFYGDTILESAQFHGLSGLHGVQFHGNTYMGGAQFHGDANLGEARFYGIVNLSGAQFHGNAILFDAQFHGNVNLGAQFHGEASLHGTRFHRYTDLTAVRDPSGAWVTDESRLRIGWVLSPASPADGPLRLVVSARKLSDASGGSEDTPHESAHRPG